MDPRELSSILERLASGDLDPETARERLAAWPFEDLGFARLDFHREHRSGMAEAVLAEGKRDDELGQIVDRFLERRGRVLVTRLAAERAPVLLERHPQGRYHDRCRVLTIEGRAEEAAPTPTSESPERLLAVLAAGTSDLSVAEEAAVCAEFFGLEVERVWDVGVAGVHRLLAHLELLRRADAVIAVAGMDGALPTLVAGLVGAPVIAVPTSVGYGAAFEGLAALLTMLNACAPGVAVVNIDNGFGAAAMAARVLGSPGMAARDRDPGEA